MKQYDVIVLGGGFTGVAAALAAARGGVEKVLLVEKSNALGGAATNCLVNPFMPYTTEINGEKVALSAGIFAEINRKLCERGAMMGTRFLEEELKLVLNRMVLSAGVELLFHAYVSRIQKNADGNIETVTVATKMGEETLGADYFIDASGDAQLAFLADCPVTLGREPDHLCQPMTLCFRLGNVDVEKFMASKPRYTEAYRKALEEGKLSNPRENVLVFNNPIKNVLHFNTTRIVKHDPTNPWDVTKAEITAREQTFEIIEFLKQNADGLENCFLMMTAAEIGVRESRMIIGDYVLTEQDCRNCVKFDDAIAACNYDIDIHNPEGTGTSHYYFPKGEYYTIPYRSLIPKLAENLLVAGRCISSDHGAQASYRIMPVVCCLGEAAGEAIALAVKEKCTVREIDVPTLQENLKQNGAFIGI